MTADRAPFAEGDRVRVDPLGTLVSYYATVLKVERDSHGFDVLVMPESAVSGSDEPRWIGSEQVHLKRGADER